MLLLVRFSPALTRTYFCSTKNRQCFQCNGICETPNSAYSVELAALNEFESCRSAGRLIVSEFEYFVGTIIFQVTFLIRFIFPSRVWHPRGPACEGFCNETTLLYKCNCSKRFCMELQSPGMGLILLLQQNLSILRHM